MSCIITYKSQKYSEEQFKEYFINNKQEFATSIARNKDVIDSFKRKMEGIDFVFSQSPELASIGSKAQYLQYLSTIFKTSKVKDIVYHYTNAPKFEKFVKDYIGSSVKRTNVNAADSELGIFFGKKGLEGVANKEKLGTTEIPALINIKNPNTDIYDKADKYLYSSDRFIDEQEIDFDTDIEEDEDGNIKVVYKEKDKLKGKDFERAWYNSYKQDLISQKKDGIVLDNIKIAFEPEQIHILGSKQDIEGFKNWQKLNLVNKQSFNFISNNNDIFDLNSFQQIADNINRQFGQLAIGKDKLLTLKENEYLSYDTAQTKANYLNKLNPEIKYVVESKVSEDINDIIYYITSHSRNKNNLRTVDKYFDKFLNNQDNASVKEVLQNVIDSKSLGEYTMLAKLLLSKVDSDITVNTSNDTVIANKELGLNAAAIWDGNSRTITFFKNSYQNIDNTQELQKRTGIHLLHEILHSLSENASTDPVFVNFYNAAKNRIINSPQYQSLTEQQKISIDYALSNSDEFLTGAFTNSAFMRLLKTLKPIREIKDIKSLWQEFLSLLKKLLNINAEVTLLDDAVTMSIDLIENNLKTAYIMSDIVTDDLVEQRNQLDTITALNSWNVMGVTSADFDLIERSDTELTDTQSKILKRLKDDTELFEDGDGNVLGTEFVSIEKDIIPLVKKLSDKKERRQELDFWNTLKLKGDQVERYKLRNQDGSVGFAYKRVSDNQILKFVKASKLKGLSDEEIAAMEESYSSEVSREMGTYLHGVNEMLMKHLSLVKPIISFKENTQSLETFESFYQKNLDIFRNTDNNELQSFYNDLDTNTKIKEKDIVKLEKLCLKLYYTIYKTQDKINTQLSKDSTKKKDIGDFVILTELKSWNPEKQLSGTQDLIVLYSDGSVGIFDYKFINFSMKYDPEATIYNEEGEIDTEKQRAKRKEQGYRTTEDLSEDDEREFVEEYKGFMVFNNIAKKGVSKPKLESYDSQLSSYAATQLSRYGVTRILQNRIVPINIQYEKEQFADGTYKILPSVKFLDTESEPVTQIPLSKETTTDDAVNQLIDKLKIEVEKYKSRLGDVESVNINIDRLNKAIAEIQINDNVDYLVLQINDLHQKIETVLDNDGANDKLQFDQILEFKDLLDTYSGLSQAMLYFKQNILSETGTSNDSSYLMFIKNIDEIESKTLILKRQLLDKLNQKLLNEFEDKKVFIDENNFNRNILEFKDLDVISVYTGKLGNAKIPQLQLIKSVLDNNFNHTKRKALSAVLDDLNVHFEKYKSWAEKKGLSGLNIYDPIIVHTKFQNKSDIKLVRELDYSSWDKKINELQSEYRKNKTNADKIAKWFLDNTELDTEGFDKAKTRYQSILQDMDMTEEERNEKLNAWESNYKISNEDKSWLSNPRLKYYLKPKESLRNNFLNKNYLELQKPENEDALEFLNYLYKLNQDIANLLGEKGNKIYTTMIPNVHKTLMEDFTLNGLKTLNPVDFASNLIKRNLVKLEDDPVLGKARQDSDSTEILDEYNRRLNIPIQFLDELSDGNNKSMDLTKSFALMYYQALNYNIAKKNESLLLAIRESVRNSNLLKTDLLGRIKNVDESLLKGEESNTLKYIDMILKRELYGIHSFDKDAIISTPFGDISRNKAVGSILGFTGLNTLSLNYLSAFGGFLATKMQLRAEASKGKHFDQKALNKVDLRWRNFDKKQIVLEHLFEIAQEDITNEKILKASSINLNKKLVEWTGSSPLMVLQRITDNRLDHEVLSAMLEHYGIGPNNEIRPLSELKAIYKDTHNTDDFKSIYDSFELTEDLTDLRNNQDNFKLITFKDVQGRELTDEESDLVFIKFRNKVRYILSTARGNQHKDDVANYQNFILGKALMQFRGWIPEMLRERFKSTEYNSTIEDIQTGRYRVVYGEIFGNGIKPALMKTLSLITEVASFGMLKGFSADTKMSQQYFDIWKAQNPGEYKQLLNSVNGDSLLAFDKFKESRMQQLKAACGELRLYLGMGVILLLLSAAFGLDDDKNESPLLLKRSIEILERARQEAGYFMDYTQFTQLITRGPIPSLSMIPNAFKLVNNTLNETIDFITLTDSNKTRNYLPVADNNSYFGINWLNQTKDSTPRLYYTTKFIPATGQITKFFDVFGKTEKEDKNLFSWLLGTNPDVVK